MYFLITYPNISRYLQYNLDSPLFRSNILFSMPSISKKSCILRSSFVDSSSKEHLEIKKYLVLKMLDLALTINQMHFQTFILTPNLLIVHNLAQIKAKTVIIILVQCIMIKKWILFRKMFFINLA